MNTPQVRSRGDPDFTQVPRAEKDRVAALE